MKKSRFSQERMVANLREADRTTVAEAAKKHKVSDATIYAWRKHFAQMEAVDVKRLKALDLENIRLKKLRNSPAKAVLALRAGGGKLLAPVQSRSAGGAAAEIRERADCEVLPHDFRSIANAAVTSFVAEILACCIGGLP